TCAALMEECVVLPLYVISNSRDDGMSGIRLFCVTEGVELITKLPGSELVQSHHRYAVVWPSTHDRTGRQYRWLDSETREVVATIPHVEDIPDLPARWVERLRAGNGSNMAKADVENAEIDRLLVTWC